MSELTEKKLAIMLCFNLVPETFTVRLKTVPVTL